MSPVSIAMQAMTWMLLERVADSTNSRKSRWFERVMHWYTHGQWWSNPFTQLKI